MFCCPIQVFYKEQVGLLLSEKDIRCDWDKITAQFTFVSICVSEMEWGGSSLGVTRSVLQTGRQGSARG